MALFVLAFIAGVLTIAAPCILPLLPVVIGGSLAEQPATRPEKQWLRPLVIAASLAVAVIVFTLLIKGSTALLGVPQPVWQGISGGIVLLLGIYYLWPHGWETLSARTGLFTKTNTALGSAFRKQGIGGAVLTGAALGPVFNSCSPTYALIVATVLPVSFLRGFALLAAYAFGMGATLLLIAYLGQAFVRKLRWLSDPGGWLRKSIGIAFIVVGVVVIFGIDKDIQTFVLDRGWYAPIGDLERSLAE